MPIAQDAVYDGMMPAHDVQNPGGGTPESPVTPTGRSKRKAKAKKKEVKKPTIEKDREAFATILGPNAVTFPSSGHQKTPRF